MALIDKASLLMVPSTYEAGKLYNVLPSGNRAPDSTNQNSGYDQTRADFDFDRGSNAAATRIGSDGLIKKYRENFLLQSNQFDTTWILNAATITGGQSGYDGNNNAWKLQDTAVTGEHFVRQTPSVGNIVSFSVYAKANTLNFLWLRSVEGGVNKRTWFDLSSGSVGTSQGIDATIEPVGTDGWYRCSATFNHQAAFEYYIAISDANGSSSYTGDGTGSIFIQNAQLEKSLVATDYLDSTSVTGKAGVLVDLPRINYDANGENGALLLEPSRANLIEQSEYFGSSYWTKSGDVTLASNYGTSPEGVQNADRIVANATSGGHIVYRNISTTGTHTISIFAKASGYNHLFLGYDGGSLNFGIIFNLSNGTIAQNPAGLTGSIEAVGSDGWHRCNLTFNYATTSYYFVVAPHDNSGNYNWTGNGTDGILIYGAQLEPNASYPSSYIPTMGTSETRAADSCLDAGNSDVFNDSEGVLFIESSAIAADSTNKVITISDGTTANRVQIYYNSSNNIIGGVAGQAAISYSGDITETTKIAFKYKANDFALWVNGVEIGTDNVGSAPSGLNQIDFHNGASGSPFYGNMKQLIYFNEALSDSELATLTTL